MLRFDQQVRLPPLNDADYVHDVAYDYYGNRLALCTSGLVIHIYSAPGLAEPKDASNDGWTEIARMRQAHKGPIWRLSWGHPESGEPLASCSDDGFINIWDSRGRSIAPQGGRNHDSGFPQWQKITFLSCDGPVMDVRFAPAPLGLKLAACTFDGKAKVFECNSGLDLKHWTPDDLETTKKRTARRQKASR